MRRPLTYAVTLLSLTLGSAWLLKAQQPPAIVSTDKTGYFADEIVAIGGLGFAPGEVVTLQVTHADGAAEPGMGHEPFSVTADGDGRFTAEWVIGLHTGAADFVLKTQGNLSGTATAATFKRIAFIYTDKFDYPAGDTAVISGLGFLPNESVTVRVEHSNGLNDGAGHDPYQIVADAAGSFTLPWYVNPDDSLGAIMRVTAVGSSSQLQATTSFTDPPLKIVDADGADESNVSEQSDLSVMSVDYTPAPGKIAVMWNWDNTATSGNNSMDACAHFDTDVNGKADYAVCASAVDSPAVMTGGLRIYTCDNLAILCSSSTLKAGPYGSSATVSVVPGSDPFFDRQGAQCSATGGNVALRCHTADTVANVTIALSDFGATAAQLTNVCAYPSKNPHVAADCILSPNLGSLTIKTTTHTPQTGPTTFAFTSSPASAGGVDDYSVSVAGTQNDVVVADRVAYAPTTSLTVTEVVPANWNLTSATCRVQGASENTGTFDNADAISGITIQAGVETVCTFTNTRQNEPPNAGDDIAIVAEDSANNAIDVLLNDTDPDGNALTVSSATTPAHGSVDISSGGTIVSYTPTANFYGSDSFTYTLSDGNGGSDTGTVTVTVSNAIDPPVSQGDATATPEDTAVTIAVLANDTDVEGDVLSLGSLAQPAHGTAVINGDGTVTYTPAPNYHGPDSFSYSAKDSGGAESTVATVSITVTPVNDAPVATGGSGSTPEDTPLSGAVAGSDVDFDTLSFTVATPPAHGTVIVAANGAFTYTPTLNYNGADSFAFTTSDGTLSAIGTFSITLTPVNDAPVATNASGTTLEDTPLTGVVAGTDVDGDTLTYAVATPPAHGTVIVAANGAFTYTPALNYNGADSFTFTTSDATLSATGTFTITVTPVNDAPAATNGSDTTLEDTPLSGVVAGTDVDGDTLTYAVATPPTHGVVTVAANGSFTYTPALNYNGADSFTFTTTDGTLSATGTFNITLTPVNDAPLATSGSGTTLEDTALSGVVAGTDVDGDALTYTVATPPSHGALTLAANGSFTYTPALNYNGPDSFMFKTSDATLSAIGTFSITLTAVNDAPVAPSGGGSTLEDTALNGAVVAMDVDGDALTYTVATSPSYGALTMAANGSFIYTPALNFNGADSFSYRASDGSMASIGMVAVVVSAVNDAPELGPLTTPAEPVSITTAVPVSANYADVDLTDTHTAVISWGDGTTSAGVVTRTGGVSNAGTITGSHTYSSPGVYTISLTVTDNGGLSDVSVTSEYVVVYDPNGGFVTGGGWLMSPSHACTVCDGATGRANFGFVSKYQRGAKTPSGETQFQFQAGNLNFHSTFYEWLVVSGARAQYKGEGRLQGDARTFGFILTATDGQASGGGGADRFRIKIWDTATEIVVYDNQMGAADDAAASMNISGGSIVIHEASNRR